MTQPMLVAIIAAMGAVGASSGVWAYLQKRSDKGTAYSRLLMGLAYDKIITVGMGYIERGGVSKDEYEEYLKYLVEPYKELGGNGVAERVAKDVGALPFKTMQFVEVRMKKEKEQ